MRAATLPLFLALSLSFSGGAALAQGQATRTDLSRYRVESVHTDWRVLCTPDGTGTRGATADCAVEDRNGFVIFVGNSGAYMATLRGFRGDDGIFSDGFSACPLGVCGTFWNGILVESIAGFVELRRDGQIVPLSTRGLAEAEQEALRRAQ
jgi:hypothetical protein